MAGGSFTLGQYAYASSRNSLFLLADACKGLRQIVARR